MSGLAVTMPALMIAYRAGPIQLPSLKPCPKHWFGVFLMRMGVLWSSFFAMHSYHPRAALVIYHQFSTPLSHWKQLVNNHYHVGNSQALLVLLSCYLLSPAIICYALLPPTPRGCLLLVDCYFFCLVLRQVVIITCPSYDTKHLKYIWLSNP